MKKKYLSALSLVTLCAITVTGITGCSSIRDFMTNEEIRTKASIDRNEFTSATEESTEETTTEEITTEEETTTKFMALAGYNTTKMDSSITTKKGKKLVAYFDLPEFYGGDDLFINQVNGDIKKLYDDFIKNTSVSEAAMKALDNDSNADEYLYSPYDLQAVFFDTKYLSIVWERVSFSGGATNYEYVTLNYNIRTGDLLTIYDIAGTNARALIADNLSEACSQKTFTSYDMDKVKFYFDEKDFYVCFNSYELDQGFSPELLKFSRNT